jgi:diguanylate cyclase (GGDEF)-like protein
MHKENYINELFARYTDSVLVVNRYEEILYANPSAVRFLCRLHDSGGYLPMVLRVFEGRYPAISLHDIVGEEIILEVNCSRLVWRDQTAKLLIMTDRTEAMQHQRELEQLVYRDELTGLCNRRGLEQRIRQLIVHAKSLQQKVNVLFIDVNRLKTINDTLGHGAGDRALLETSEVIRQSFGEGAINARIGGDEFAVFQIVDPAQPFQDAIDLIEARLNELNNQKDRSFTLSLSIGMSQYSPEEKFDLAKLLQQADKNMYRAKEGYDVVQLLKHLGKSVTNNRALSYCGHG